MTRQDVRTGPAPAAPTSQRTPWLLFGPPAFTVALRWLLQMADDRQSGTSALSLIPVSTTAGMLELIWPMSVALALLAAAGLIARRFGWRRFMRLAGVAWLLLWLAASGLTLQRHLNRQGIFLQDMAGTDTASGVRTAARVMTSQFKPPSLRSLGGTELVLRVDGLDIPQRLLIDDPRAAVLKPGATLALRLAPGRFSELFVTGWRQASPAATNSPIATP